MFSPTDRYGCLSVPELKSLLRERGGSLKGKKKIGVKDKLYVYSCRFNYRPDHCMYTSVCKPAEAQGVAVIHGSRGYFHSEKQPIFQAVYRSFEEFQLGGDLYRDFYQPLEVYLEGALDNNCGNVKDIFLKNIRKHMDLEFEER